VSKKVTFQKAVYLGGLPGDKGGYKGNLFASDEALGMGQFSGPKKSSVRWDDMAGISFDSGTAAKSRAGKALLVGVFALAAKKTQKEATVTVTRKDGNVAIYQITGVSGAEVRAKVQPFMVENSVPCMDDAPLVAAAPTPAPATIPTPASAPAADPADQLKKLADLHQSGLLTDEEFAAKRTAIVDKL
jgi:hypothetical protein